MAAAEDKVAAYVRGILARDGASADTIERQQRFRPESPDGASDGVAPEDLDALRKIERQQPLTADEQIRIEAVVVPDGLRPSFDVRNDSFARLPDAWADVEASRAVLESMIKAIGRLNLAGHPSRPFGGTAFVVAQDLLLTNRHVAEFFVDGPPGTTLQFKPGMTSNVDLKQEVASADSITVRVTAPAVILDNWDAALLRIEPLPAGVQPLSLAGAPPPSIESRLVVVVGYPALDPFADIFQQIHIFRGVFDKKRLTPGRLMGFRSTPSFGRSVTALAHDCTTVGGNSGSAVIDVGLGRVVGLHFAGDQFVANYSVPSWELAGEPAVMSAGVVFA